MDDGRRDRVKNYVKEMVDASKEEEEFVEEVVKLEEVKVEEVKSEEVKVQVKLEEPEIQVETAPSETVAKVNVTPDAVSSINDAPTKNQMLIHFWIANRNCSRFDDY